MLDEPSVSPLPSLPPSQSLLPANPQHPARFADVMLPRYLSQAFTYAIPARFQNSLRIGQRVVVPFGKKVLQGLVVSLHHAQPPDPRPTYREIQDVLDQPLEDGLNTELLALAHFVSRYYLAPLGQCLRFILPPIHAQPISTRVRLTTEGRDALQNPKSRLAPPARAILERLQRTDKGLTRRHLQHAIPGRLDPTLRRLRQRGLVSEEPASARRRETGKSSSSMPSEGTEHEVRCVSMNGPGSVPPPKASIDSSVAAHPDWPRIRDAIKAASHQAFLLKGSPRHRASWFTAACAETLARGRSVLIVTHEIRRAAELASLAASSWPTGVTLLHSDLPASQRKALWQDIKTGLRTVVIGTRSAIFAPLPNTGLIIVDEEDSPHLKEEQSPHYHARTVAFARAEWNRAVVLLGSDHPSLEIYAAAAQSPPSLTPVEVEDANERTADLPRVVLADLRESPRGTLLSQPLVDGIAQAVDTGTGVILFLNRKGYAPSLLCRTCGQTILCPTCRITQRFYKKQGRLVCHYCGREAAVPDLCPTCASPDLEPVGVGTERLEEAVRQRFAAARIGRLDRETTRTEAQAEEVRAAFRSGSLNVLIGTQLLLEDPSLPPAGCVGIPCADVGLHLPDFRSAERSFHALMDAQTLARSMDHGGLLVLQTYMPAHHTMQALTRQDPSLFYEQELGFRQVLGYPPFTHMIRLRIAGSGKDQVHQAAKHWADILYKEIGEAYRRYELSSPEALTVLGPVPPMIPHVRGRHRLQLFIKAETVSVGQDVAARSLKSMEERVPRGLKIDVDVDPMETL